MHWRVAIINQEPCTSDYWTMSALIHDQIHLIYAVVKKYHRHALWLFLGILFGLDIITTSISLHEGYSEENPLMMPFAQNPLFHGIVKIIVYIILFIVLEKAVIFIHERRPEKAPFLTRLNFELLYGIIIFILVYLIWLYLHVVINNTRLIY
jgi:hypothetical protein